MHKRFELEKKLMEELQETRELYEMTMDEGDILMNFIMEHNLTKMLDNYIYEQLKDCKDSSQLDSYVRLITHEPDETKELTLNIGKEVYIDGVRVK
ncbi:hypothetical protein IFU39_19105 [Paenibacillus sp. CFBP 13594]|uniref:hypothetical protein n=1 Tax=Paenibacillus sp. CFBP 13594 TaxID=2774037 RepID=UPI00177C8640|nr:hypothetical protein [Paenibacillus sp. CFBP 13594]MBD8839926.1 hypothetical protein [Paenibacillus sp. CFBP 13594]